MDLKELKSRHGISTDRGLTLKQFVTKYFPNQKHLIGGGKQKEAPQSKPLEPAILPESVSEVSTDNSPAKTPQQKWREKNKKRLADYQKTW